MYRPKFWPILSSKNVVLLLTVNRAALVPYIMTVFTFIVDNIIELLEEDMINKKCVENFDLLV
jgi:hypothetical protein